MLASKCSSLFRFKNSSNSSNLSIKKTNLFQRSTKQNFSRSLNIHEYQSQELMRKYQISVPEGAAASTPEEAYQIAKKLGGEVVIKAQILAGGRGLGKFNSGLQGGVHLCKNADDVRNYAKQMLGFSLITKQTGPQGIIVQKVLIAKKYTVKRENYVAFTLDRSFQGPVMIASHRGGVNIEKVAEEEPTAIIKKPIDLLNGPKEEDLEQVATGLQFNKTQIPAVVNELKGLWKLFKEKDATMIEVNPFVETSDHKVLCLDAKINFDDNSKFRQNDVFAMEDFTQKDIKEVEAAKYDLNYIALDGNIACLVNGAGLAMATMDIIKLYGGNPANFLDVGGGASQQQVFEAIKILVSDKNVKAILVNIFGGIMRCEIIANGLIKAVNELKVNIPLVVRLQGTNMELARKLIQESGLKIESINDLDQAAQAAVRIAKEVETK